MIWTITLWLAMQGQVQHVHMNGNMVCDEYPDTMVCYAEPPDAEHVFEIRTKREESGQTKVCSYMTFTGNPSCYTIPTPTYCPSGNSCEDVIHITRELYMDGKRLGIIKGMD